MPQLDEIGGWIAKRLPELITEHKVPGAAIGVYAGGQVIDYAFGVLSRATGVEATTDSVFQVGSITKTWTATLVMQLVDEGLLDIDKPLRGYLPEFTLADEAAAQAITTRQLLSHQAGFEGDIFTDTGNNDDCVEKYVATLATDPQLFPPGQMFSYNNAGYCVLGRLVEVLRGKPFDQALREHLFAPLGLAHAATDAASAILFRAAVGHLPGDPADPDAYPAPAPVWSRRGAELSFTAVAVVLGAIPGFLLAFGLIDVFSVQLGWTPVALQGGFSSYALPVLSLAIGPAVILARILRLEVLAALQADYVRTARAKRLPSARLYLGHVLPNALTATITVCGLLLAGLVAGTVLIENVFAWPGLGQTMVASIISKDYPVVQGIVLVYGTGVLLVNLVVDVTLALLDPRSTIREA
jgi:CubicO group peptidase (beta-lactamase class C family)